MLKTLSVLFSTRIISAALALISLAVFVRILTPEQFTIYSIVISTSTILNEFFFRWINASVSRFFHNKFFGDNIAIISLNLILYICFSIIFLGLIISFILENYWGYILLTALFTASLGLYQLNLVIVRIMRDSRSYAVMEIGRTVAMLALGCGFALAGLGASGALFGAIVSTLAAMTLGFRRFPEPLRAAAPKRSTLAAFLSYGGPAALSGGATMVLLTSNRYVMIDATTATQAAYFIAAATFSERAIRMLMSNLNITLAPSLFEQHENGAPEKLDELLKGLFIGLCVLALPLGMVMSVSADFVARMVLGPEVGPGAARHFPFLAWSAVLWGFTSSYFGLAFMIARRTTVGLYVTAPMILVNVALAYALIAVIGEIGAAAASLTTAAIATVVMATLARRHHPMPLPLGGALRMAAATAVGVPVMLLANQQDSAVVAFALLVLSAAMIGVAALLLNVPGLRRLARSVVCTILRRV